MTGEPAAWQRTVALPVGVDREVDGDVVTVREATLRKMTGREEALLTDPKLKGNSGGLITALLGSCVVGMDGFEQVDAKLMRRLSSADRNFLLLELRRLTFGDRIETHYRCPSCGGETYLEEDLADIEVRGLDETAGGSEQEVVVTLEDGFQAPDGEWHFELVFRFPTGEDEEVASGRRDKNQVRQQDALLTRCLLRVGDMDPKRVRAMGTRIIASLSMADRRRIQRALDQAAPGPNLLREIVCDQCGEAFRSALDMRHFFPME